MKLSILKPLFGLITGLTLMPAMASQLDVTEVRQGYMKHAAMAQLHRWYQIYENAEVPVENQLDILFPDIKLKSALGEGQGHAVYRERLKQIPSTWKNAHFVKEPIITISADKKMMLTTEIEYINVGMKKDGSARAAQLRYDTTLESTGDVLPRFTEISISQLKENTAPEEFTSAYSDNRMRSLMHYWLALMEDPARQIAPFKEILAKDFTLNFPSGTVNNDTKFETWFRGTASAVEASTHIIRHFSSKQTGPNQYLVEADFDWQGILPNGTQMQGQTHHTWIVIDNPKERFARISTMNVKLTQAFAPIKRVK